VMGRLGGTGASESEGNSRTGGGRSVQRGDSAMMGSAASDQLSGDARRLSALVEGVVEGMKAA